MEAEGRDLSVEPPADWPGRPGGQIQARHTRRSDRLIFSGESGAGDGI